MASGIASGFVRKLYRILDHESNEIICWDVTNDSFSVLDSEKLNSVVLPRYFRGRLRAFRQQLADHGFIQVGDKNRESYRHPYFVRGCPSQLEQIVRNPKLKRIVASDTSNVRIPMNRSVQISIGGKNPLTSSINSLTVTLDTNRRVAPFLYGKPLKRRRVTCKSECSSVVAHQLDPLNVQNHLFTSELDSKPDVSQVSSEGSRPCCAVLPEPVSYLTMVKSDTPRVNYHGWGRKDIDNMATTTSNIFSEDTIKSALFLLLSSTSDTALTSSTQGIFRDVEMNPTLSQLSSSRLLISLFRSSEAQISAGPNLLGEGNVFPTSNPLFDKSDRYDDDDSIWNLLVATSIERAKVAMSEPMTPHERLRCILNERELLEENWKQLCGMKSSCNEIMPSSCSNCHSSSISPSSFTLSYTSPIAATNSLDSTRIEAVNEVNTVSAQRVDDYDGIWKLLMSSSIDWLRKSAAEFERNVM